MTQSKTPENMIPENISPEDANSVWGNQETQYFFSLDPVKVLSVAEKFGIKCTGRVLQLNSMENRVFQLEIYPDDDSLALTDPMRYRIIKFYRPGRWSKEQILEEHSFLQELVAEEYPVVAPISLTKGALTDGSTIYQDTETGLLASLFPRVGGRNVDELRPEQIQIVGRLLARLHVVGKRSNFSHRLTLNTKTYGDQNLNLILSSNLMPPDFETVYADLVDDLLDMIDPILEGATNQRVHGDCHLGNLLDGQAGLLWVDFDDVVMAPPVQDIWLVESGRDDYSKRRLDELLSSYETFNSFDNSSLSYIEPLRTLRLIHFSAWIGKRYSDPAFKKAFPDYGTIDYWSDQLETLREQAEIVSSI